MTTTRNVLDRDHVGEEDGLASVDVSVIDCDVHPAPAEPSEILQFLPKRWHYTEKYDLVRVPWLNAGKRDDSVPERGGPPGSDPVLMERQLLGDAAVDFAIMIYHTKPNLPDPDADAARCAAYNEWLAAYWLGDYNSHGRYFGSIRLPMQNPSAAVREIERWSDHPNFVQALAVYAYAPAFGHPMYEPILRAAAEHELPIAIHATNSSQQEGTAFGPPAYQFEWHATAYVYGYAAHLASLICCGVFEELPDLRFVMVEGGIGWSQALGDHLDNNWRILRDDAPTLKLAPSEYLERNVVFTTQPIEEPASTDALLQTYERLNASKRVLFATDYPHWDFDDPKRSLPRMPKELKSRILFENACDFYGFPRQRPDIPLSR